MKYANVVTDDSVLVLNIETGEQVKFFKGDINYDTALNLLSEDRIEDIFNLDTKHVINKFFEIEDEYRSVTVTIEDGEGWVVLHDFNDMKVKLQPAITNRILKISKQGLSPKSLVNFISNLYTNPSKTAIEELYLFIEACELPITEDGCFIAYKIVNNDYTDIYTGKIDNSIGSVVSIPRHMVNDNRNITCSTGLHFCSKEYLPYYGSSSKNNDRCLLVKINPSDVVSIPSDYNNAKGRTCKYEVVGEVSGNWRSWLPYSDYTESAVVTSNSVAIFAKDIKEKNYISSIYKSGYLDGYSDGKHKVPFQEREDKENESVDEADYNDGYDLGYKHGRHHKRKLFK